MDHGNMGHGHDHGDMDMPMPAMCSMNMLFTWDTTNLCIIFRGWRITGPWSLVWSLVAVAALTAGYEAVREASRRYEQRQAARLENAARNAAARSMAAEESRTRLVKALFYGVQVFYSFFIMLLFMTYNGWVMIAVGVGAFLGYLAFGGASPVAKTAACH